MAHEEHCGCCQEHSRQADKRVTENQKAFLHQLSHSHYLPVARFTLADSREEDFCSTALAPVFLRSAGDSMDAVKEAGAFLQGLEDQGLLTLDYDIPLSGYGYEEYRQSALYKYFCATVAEGAGKPGFLGDTPVLELGSMALTEEGEEIAASCCEHSRQHCQ